MRRIALLASIASVAFVFFSCRSSKDAASISALNGEWDIVEINGSAVVVAAGQHAPYIGFESASGKIYGNSGCNRIMGSFDVNAQPGTIDLGTLAGTRMLCEDMTTETNVLNAFKNVKGYKVLSTNKMALTNMLNRPIVVLERRAARPQVSMLEGEWKIVEAGGTAIPADLEKRPYISFNTVKKSIHGNAGCNMINGGFNLDEKDPKAISFPAVAATMMMCPDMEVERKVLTAINDTKSFTVISDESVVFYDEAGKITLKLEK